MSFKPKYTYNPYEHNLKAGQDHSIQENVKPMAPPRGVIHFPPQKLKELARLVTRAFYQPITIVVMDLLIEKHFIVDEELAQGLGLSSKQVRAELQRLKRDLFVGNATSNQKKGYNGHSTAVQYWFVDYQALVDTVQFRCHVMSKHKTVVNDNSSSQYRCSNKECLAKYTDLEVLKLLDRSSGEFKCAKCASCVDSATHPEMDATSSTDVASQLGPIKQLLVTCQQIFQQRLVTDDKGRTMFTEEAHRQLELEKAAAAAAQNKDTKQEESKPQAVDEPISTIEVPSEEANPGDSGPTWFQSKQAGAQDLSEGGKQGREGGKLRERFDKKAFDKYLPIIEARIKEEEKEPTSRPSDPGKKSLFVEGDNEVVQVGGEARPFYSIDESDMMAMTDDEYRKYCSVFSKLYPTVDI